MKYNITMNYKIQLQSWRNKGIFYHKLNKFEQKNMIPQIHQIVLLKITQPNKYDDKKCKLQQIIKYPKMAVLQVPTIRLHPLTWIILLTIFVVSYGKYQKKNWQYKKYNQPRYRSKYRYQKYPNKYQQRYDRYNKKKYRKYQIVEDQMLEENTDDTYLDEQQDQPKYRKNYLVSYVEQQIGTLLARKNKLRKEISVQVTKPAKCKKCIQKTEQEQTMSTKTKNKSKKKNKSAVKQKSKNKSKSKSKSKQIIQQQQQVESYQDNDQIIQENYNIDQNSNQNANVIEQPKSQFYEQDQLIQEDSSEEIQASINTKQAIQPQVKKIKQSQPQVISIQPIMQVIEAVKQNVQVFQANKEPQSRPQPKNKKAKQLQKQKAKQFTHQQCLQKPVYDYNLLVLTWIPVNCYGDQECQKDWLSYDDFKSPTIHGYRPFGSSSYYENCFGQQEDFHCTTDSYLADFDIDEALWNVTGLSYQISQYWPALKFTHDEISFYVEQWRLHGTCYLMNMIQDNPNAYKYDRSSFNRTIMVEYFRTTISKFKQLSIKVQPGKQYDYKQDFATDIGFKGKQTHFVLSCDQNNQVNQITFCFNRSKLPGKQVTIPCTLTDSCDEDTKFKFKQPK